METDDGYERDGWQAINGELSLTAIRIPESYGGHGFGFGEQCIVLEEMGLSARSWLGWQIPILTTDAHGSARIEAIDGAEIVRRMERYNEVAVVAGFQA